VSRQKLETDEEGIAVQPAVLLGASVPPFAWETGRKDTVVAYPGEVTRVKAKFDRAGLFVWHCHIVEHEDHEMMRPYVVGST
jgi:FtsP/CotA-like multicopper oxidase with cupredoxin domain